jgi:RimJ/RimL family protein N-acetyltransferase
MTPHDSIMLQTPRLTLRRFADTDADAELLVELDSDPEVMRYIGPHRLSVAEYRERIRTAWLPHYAHPLRGCGAAYEKSTGLFIGWFFLRPAADHQHAAAIGLTRVSDIEIGYRLKRAAWGRGLATEAARELVRIALDDGEVTSVVAHALVSNRASIRVMEKAGLAFVREFPVDGFTEPAALYAACRVGCSPP